MACMIKNGGMDGLTIERSITLLGTDYKRRWERGCSVSKLWNQPMLPNTQASVIRLFSTPQVLHVS